MCNYLLVDMSSSLPEAMCAVIVVLMAAEGSYGRILPGLDNCRGMCTNLTGYFCAPFLGICEPCDPHCEEENEDGCMETCEKWAVQLSTTPSTQTTLQPSSSSTEPGLPRDSNDTHVDLMTSISSMDGSIETGPHELPGWVYFALLAAGVIFSIFIWNMLKKCRCDQKRGPIVRENDMAGQRDIEMNDLGHARGTPPPDAAEPLLPDEPSQPGSSQSDGSRSLSSEPGEGPTQPLRGPLSVPPDSAYETAAAPHDDTVAVSVAQVTNNGGDTDSEKATPAGSLTVNIHACPVQQELRQGAEPFHGRGEPFMDAAPSLQEPTTPIGQTVQDGTITGHELVMSASSPFSFMNGDGLSYHQGLIK
ncbi:uncharacterized protein [Diadema setosum]|uniref:uncharacterized protein n=1 Tax=Diadema setosum TaxID=31175 RepID=UPI003B3BE577